MPEWMLHKDEYTPQPDKDAFLGRSIQALLGVCAKLRVETGKRTVRPTVNACFKVFFTVVLIVLLSLARGFAFVLLINVYLLLLVSLQNAGRILKILKVSFTAAIFTLIIFLPSIFLGNTHNGILATFKVLASVTAVNLLSSTTDWNPLTNALKTFHIPDIFILVLDISIKYILLLGDFSLSMLYSLKLRSVGRNREKYNSLSGVVGTLFIKSREMAEEMYGAMECRGFTGEYTAGRKWKVGAADFLYSLVNVSLILAFVYLER